MAFCGLSIVGTDSLVSVNHIKRARYCIQVATSVMFSLLYQPTRTVVTKALYCNESNDDSAGSRFPFFTTILAKYMRQTLVLV